MTLKQYLLHINKMAKKNPKLLDMQVVYSRDEEGNSFHSVCFGATAGRFDEDAREFESSDEVKKSEINAVCVN